MSDTTAFGLSVKRYRLARGFTQDYLAEQVGCATQTIRKIEGGQRRPSYQMAERLAQVLAIAPAEHAAWMQAARADVASQHLAETVGATTLLASKLHAPGVPALFITRSRLLTRLATGLAGPLTLVAAPAGFGKTTLVAAGLTTVPYPSGWLALDTADNDPVVFLRYVIATIQAAEPTIGRQTLHLLNSLHGDVMPAISAMLLHELAALEHDIVVVLDDYHIITNTTIHRLLERLLDHPPMRLHLVVLTREDPPLPLARLRVRGQLAELRAADLRFTTGEASDFLRETMHLDLTPAQVVALEDRTEGWIAGLQLAALSLQQQAPERADALITAFTGSHRFIADYLLDEVFAQQPAHIQQFLLSTSILERFCGPLCDSVLGIEQQGPVANSGFLKTDSYSQLVLEQLERQNLFLIPLDEERRWYRYHHLFATLLRSRLATSVGMADQVRLHERACDWLSRHANMAEAVEHAFAAQDYARAANLMEREIAPLLSRGAFHTLARWLDALPPDLVASRARLCLSQITLRLDSAHIDEAAHWYALGMALLPQQMQDNEARDLAGQYAALGAMVAAFSGNPQQVHERAERALHLLAPDNLRMRGVATACQALVTMWSGNYAMAVQQFANAEQLGWASGDAFLAVSSANNRVFVLRAQGLVKEASALSRLTIKRIEEQHIPALLACGIFSGLADLLREQGQRDEALILAHQAVTLSQQWGHADYVVIAQLVLARVLQAHDDHTAAQTALDQAHDQAYALPQMLPTLAAFAQQLCEGTGTNTTDGMSALLADALLPYPYWGPHGLVYDYEHRRIAPAQALFALAHRTGDQALLQLLRAHLAELRMRADNAGLHWLQVKTRVLEALTYDSLSDQAAASALAEALTLAAPAGYRQLFVDEGPRVAALLDQVRPQAHLPDVYITHLRAAYPPTVQNTAAPQLVPTVAQALIEPLTDRELAVLRLLASGATNQDIANQLVIALATAKKHSANIFGKLSVRNRTEAVAAARELGLI